MKPIAFYTNEKYNSKRTDHVIAHEMKDFYGKLFSLVAILGTSFHLLLYQLVP